MFLTSYSALFDKNVIQYLLYAAQTKCTLKVILPLMSHIMCSSIADMFGWLDFQRTLVPLKFLPSSVSYSGVLLCS